MGQCNPVYIHMPFKGLSYEVCMRKRNDMLMAMTDGTISIKRSKKHGSAFWTVSIAATIALHCATCMIAAGAGCDYDWYS
jgi:hypothetical protein